MDDRGEPQRIEIELTERAPGRAGRRRRDRAAPEAVRTPDPAPPVEQRFDPAQAAVVTSDPEQIGGGPLATERGRLVAATLTAGVVALFVGWALGRSGDDDTATRTVDSTVRVATATTVPETVLPGETIPEAETARPTAAPTTSRPPRTTTTTIPPVWEESTITIDPRLAGVTDRLVAITADRDLIELDLATGALRSLDVASWPTGQTPYAPVAGDDFIAVQFDNGNAPEVYVGDDTTSNAIVTNSWVVSWDVPARTVWEMGFDDEIAGRPSQLIERTVDGEPTGRSIDLNGLWPSGVSDPAGGILVGDSTIGVYNVSPDGSRRIAGGRPLAFGMSHILSYSCGDTLDDCGLRIVDRASGESRAVPIDDEVPLSSLLNGWWAGPVTTAQVTSDGRAAMLGLAGDSGIPALYVIDTATGAVTRFGGGAGPGGFGYPSGVWSSDDRWLYVVVDGVATAYDRTTGEQFPISAELPDTASLTIRIAG